MKYPTSESFAEWSTQYNKAETQQQRDFWGRKLYYGLEHFVKFLIRKKISGSGPYITTMRKEAEAVAWANIFTRGISKFNPEKGKLMTYLSHWISSAAFDTIYRERYSVVRPSRRDIKTGDDGKMSYPYVRVVRLDALRSTEEGERNIRDMTLFKEGHFLTDERARSQTEAEFTVRSVLDACIVDSRQKMIIEQRLQERTLQSLGTELGITRERVRQLESTAHSKIKEYLTKNGIGKPRRTKGQAKT